ncbi:ABC transporter permease [Paenibacillus piri]|uniref:ABC transporter permease n=1 Tax=Paenibacillus piri TaxID=2547395 RepID=A0A4R5K844_9BACL|nr:ABC transporter permease [Paenibacillus piri]TDF89729.1 ABC transporter permease [Paenibacillus piri]
MRWASGLQISFTGLAVLFILLPILVTIPASFTEASFPSFPPHGFSFKWYEKLFNRPEYMAAFFNSVEIAVVTSLFAVILGTAGALAVAKYDLPGKSFIVSVLTAPLTAPQLVLGAALLIYFTPMSLSGTLTGLLIAHIVICVPFVMRYALAGLSGFDYTLERAAMILGANPFQVFWKVTLPLLRPAIVSGGLFAFLTSFDNVTVSLFLVSTKMKTLPIEIYSNMQDSFDPLVATVSSMVIFISVLFIILLEKIHGVGRFFEGTH